MSAAIAEVPAVEKNRCKIDEVFASPFIELISLAPMNPVVRGLILAQTRRMPGPDCETFEQVKEWVETTCEKKARSPNQPPFRAAEGITINVEFSETEYGSANYSVHRSGEGEFAINAGDLLEMVQKAIDNEEGIDGVVDRIAEEIDDNAWNQCEPDLNNYGDYDYDNYDSNDTDNQREEYSRTQIRDRLHAFLRQRHPQLLEEFP
jgi:hypothetical protein